jgi:Ca2+/H+ antiporter
MAICTISSVTLRALVFNTIAILSNCWLGKESDEQEEEDDDDNRTPSLSSSLSLNVVIVVVVVVVVGIVVESQETFFSFSIPFSR